MKQYRKKPVVIEAIQFTDETFLEVDEIEGITVYTHGIGDGDSERFGLPAFASITTLEGTMTASLGDYIIRGVKGELRPCKPDIFEATYESVGNELVRVVFDIWGQRSETIFTKESELSPAQWCVTVQEKGFALPISIIDAKTGDVLVDEKKMGKVLAS